MIAVDYTVQVKGGSEAEEENQEQPPDAAEDAPMMEVDYPEEVEMPEGATNLLLSDSDNEINFSPTITVRKPAPQTPSPAVVPKTKAKPKARTKGVRKPAPAISKSVYSMGTEADGEGHRHSRRNKISPLEFWRNETVKYAPSKELNMPVVSEVIRKARTPQKARPRKATKPAKRKQQVEAALEEAGFARELSVVTQTVDYDTLNPEERMIAISLDQHTPSTPNKDGFSISTLFQEGAFLSAGMLFFPRGTGKAPRNSATHALVFCVVQGAFEVTVHETTFVIGPGGQFLVPRGNNYQINNVWDGDSKLHFCHCKDVSA